MMRLGALTCLVGGAVATDVAVCPGEGHWSGWLYPEVHFFCLFYFLVKVLFGSFLPRLPIRRFQVQPRPDAPGLCHALGWPGAAPRLGQQGPARKGPKVCLFFGFEGDLSKPGRWGGREGAKKKHATKTRERERAREKEVSSINTQGVFDMFQRGMCAG